MWDMNEVQRIEYKHAYIYEVHFDNGLSAEVDFAPYLTRGPVFEPLRDILSTSRKLPWMGGRSPGLTAPTSLPRVFMRR